MTADAGIHGHDPACDCKQCVTAQRAMRQRPLLGRENFETELAIIHISEERI